MALIVLAGIVLWAPDKSRVELENAYGTPKNSYVTALGVKIHYQDTGPSQNPIPILFLHGFGSSLHTWDAWTKDLSSKYRVISVDLPGFGLKILVSVVRFRPGPPRISIAHLLGY